MFVDGQQCIFCDMTDNHSLQEFSCVCFKQNKLIKTSENLNQHMTLWPVPSRSGSASGHQLAAAPRGPVAAAGRTWSRSSSAVALIRHSSTEWSITINAWQQEGALYSRKSVSLSNVHCWNSPVALEMRMDRSPQPDPWCNVLDFWAPKARPRRLVQSGRTSLNGGDERRQEAPPCFRPCGFIELSPLERASFAVLIVSFWGFDWFWILLLLRVDFTSNNIIITFLFFC